MTMSDEPPQTCPPSPRPKPLALPSINAGLPDPRSLLPPSYRTSTQAPDLPRPSKRPKPTIPPPPILITPKSPIWNEPSSSPDMKPARISPLAPKPAAGLKRSATEMTHPRCQHTARVFLSPSNPTLPPVSTKSPPLLESSINNSVPPACEDCTKAAAISSETSLRRHYHRKIWELETWVKGLIPGKGQKGSGIDLALMDARYEKAQEIRDLKALRDFEIDQAWAGYERFFQPRPTVSSLDPDEVESDTDSLIVEALSDHSDMSMRDPDPDVREVALGAIARKGETSTERAKREWHERGKAEFVKSIEEEISGMKEKIGKAWEKGKVNDKVLDSCRLSEEAMDWWKEKDVIGFLRYEKRIGRIKTAGERRRLEDEKDQDGRASDEILKSAGEQFPLAEKGRKEGNPKSEAEAPEGTTGSEGENGGSSDAEARTQEADQKP